MKIGDYIRTDIGEIRKVVRVTDDLYVLDKDVVFAHKDKIKKSSSNIIDLIEEDDYVNGKLVCDIITNKNGKRLHLNMYPYEEIKNEDIKSIVTSEQFESMEYKLGDRDDR